MSEKRRTGRKSVCEVDVESGGGAVTVASELEVGPTGAIDAMPDSGLLAPDMDAMTVGESGCSLAMLTSTTDIGAFKAIVVAVATVVAAIVDAPKAQGTSGAVEVTAVPSWTS